MQRSGVCLIGEINFLQNTSSCRIFASSAVASCGMVRFVKNVRLAAPARMHPAATCQTGDPLLVLLYMYWGGDNCTSMIFIVRGPPKRSKYTAGGCHLPPACSPARTQPSPPIAHRRRPSKYMLASRGEGNNMARPQDYGKFLSGMVNGSRTRLVWLEPGIRTITIRTTVRS